jgi:hypothetical protein
MKLKALAIIWMNAQLQQLRQCKLFFAVLNLLLLAASLVYPILLLIFTFD